MRLFRRLARSWPVRLALLVFLAGIAALLAIVLVRGEKESAPPPPPTTTQPLTTTTQPSTTTTQPPPTTTPPPATTQPPTQPTVPPPPAVAFSWKSAGAFVWHETDLEPTLLGRVLREAGFGWVAVRLHDGLEEDPVEADWVYRFRLASGLPVGGWGVLRTDPEQEAALASSLLDRYGLDFYIANPETEYEFSGVDGPSAERSGRSARFVAAFRSVRPAPFPVGLSSYCRPDRHDIDWAAWRNAGVAFLPEAYVNDVGMDVAPAACVAAADGVFPRADIHPTIGMHVGAQGVLDVATYIDLLAAAKTVGFSVYLAETRMTDADWHALGTAMSERGIAVPAD
jgi:hypothetical protein